MQGRHWSWMGGGETPEVVAYVVEAGGGHRAAANALVAAAEQCHRPFRLTVVSLQTVLDPLDPLRRLTGLSIQEAYNGLLRTQHTGQLAPLLRVIHAAIRIRKRALVARVARDLAQRRPRAIVSLVPNFNGVIRDAVAASVPGTPLLVVLTDFADFPPHFWVEAGVDLTVVGTRRAEEQARLLGVPRERIARSSGMILHPHFYPTRRPEARASLRRELGLHPERPIVLVVFGGKGSKAMAPLSAGLLDADAEWQVVAVCGDNPHLFESLGSLEGGSNGRLHRVGFTDRIADYLAAADVLVTKPGPGSLAEAFHQGVPVVVSCNRNTIPQERYNAAFVEENNLGLLVRDEREMPSAAARLVRDTVLRRRAQDGLAALPENRAVFEVLDIIAAEIDGVRQQRSVAVG